MCHPKAQVVVRLAFAYLEQLLHLFARIVILHTVHIFLHIFGLSDFNVESNQDHVSLSTPFDRYTPYVNSHVGVPPRHLASQGVAHFVWANILHGPLT